MMIMDNRWWILIDLQICKLFCASFFGGDYIFFEKRDSNHPPWCSSLLYPIPTHFTFIWTNIQTVWPIFMLSELNMFLCLSLTTNLLLLLCWVCLSIGKGEGYLRGDQGREGGNYTHKYKIDIYFLWKFWKEGGFGRRILKEGRFGRKKGWFGILKKDLRQI